MRIGLIQAFAVMLPSGRFEVSSSCNHGRPYGRSPIRSLSFAFAYKRLRRLLHGSASKRGSQA